MKPLHPIENLAEAARILREGSTFWVSSHLLVDGDGLGSALGLQHSLRLAGKEAHAYNEAPLPRHLGFLPGYDEVEHRAPSARPDAIFIMDTPVPERLGSIRHHFPEGVPIVVLDHHVSNRRFGTVNVVDLEASSTGELVYRLILEAALPIDGPVANCLLTAIYTDTGRFAYSNTSPETLEVAADLLRRGAALREVSRGTYESRTRGELELQKRVIARLHLDAGGRLAWTHLARNDLAETGCQPHEGQDLVEIPRSLEGVEMAIFFRETPTAVKISMRSEGEIDVCALAARFGGGGHKHSAGCSVDGPLEETMEAVLAAAREVLDG